MAPSTVPEASKLISTTEKDDEDGDAKVSSSLTERWKDTPVIALSPPLIMLWEL
jgi:hypothetical protein